MTQKNFSFLNSYLKGETLLGGWGFIGNGLAALNAFLLVSYLTVFDYGVYLLIIAFFSLVSSLPLGLMQGVVLNDVTRFIGIGDEARAKRLFFENTVFQLSIAFLLSAATFMGAEFVALWYGKDIALLIRIISPLFLISAFYTTMRMVFSARLQFGVMATRSVAQKILRFVFLLPFVFSRSLDVKYALVAFVSATFFSVLICIPSFIRAYAPWKRIRAVRERIQWGIMKSYGKWSFFGEGAKSSILDLKPWLIKFFVNTEAVAIYSIAESLFGVIKDFLPTATLMMLFPRVAHDKQRTIKTLLGSAKYLLLASLLIGAIAAVGVPPLVRFLVPHYTGSIILFYILLPTLPLLAFRSPMAAFLTAHRRQRFLFLRQVIVSVNILVIPFLLLPLFGVVGMAIERLFTSVLITVLTFWYLTRHNIPLAAWRSIFHWDKNDRAFLLRVIHLFRKKLSIAKHQVFG